MAIPNRYTLDDFTYIIPVRNEENQLQECILSIRAFDQISRILVINDNSTDSTAAKVLELDLPNLEIQDSHGIGISAALNTGLDLAGTSFCIRLDADDRNLKLRSFKMVEAVNEESSTVYFTNARFSPLLAGLIRPKYLKLSSEKNLKWLLLVSNVIIHPTVCLNMNLRLNEMKYPEESGVEDYLLWIKILMRGGYFKYNREKTILYNRSSKATSAPHNRLKNYPTELAIATFNEFQEFTLGRASRDAAITALTGGKVCESASNTLSHYLHIFIRAPLRVKPNLLFNCSIMMCKIFIYPRAVSRSRGKTTP
jgi:glycosyltransferase involved in cell wall biosynthesis